MGIRGLVLVDINHQWSQEIRCGKLILTLAILFVSLLTNCVVSTLQEKSTIQALLSLRLTTVSELNAVQILP